MPKFRVLSRVDAFVDYIGEVEAETPEQAVNLAYDGYVEVKWKPCGVTEFQARHVVALDDDDNEIETTARGDFH